MEDDLHWVVLAQLLRPQGRKGELLAELYTDFPERFEGSFKANSEDLTEEKIEDRDKALSRVYLAKPDFTGTVAQARPIEVSSYWLPMGKNQGRVVLQFVGIDSIDAAEKLAGLEVIVPREERLPLEDEASYISDLIGCTVYDGSVPVGTIQDVQFTTTPDGLRRMEEIAPMLVLRSPTGEELLVPFAKDFLVTIDAAAKRVEMTLPEGLLDVNR